MYAPSRRKQKKIKQKRIQKIQLLLLLAFSVTVLVYLIAVSPVSFVRGYEISGNTLVETDAVSRQIDTYFTQYGSGLAPQESLVLINTSALESYIAEAFPQIDSLEVSRTFRGTLSIVITERSTVYIVCSERKKNACYYADVDGFIFQEIISNVKNDSQVIFSDREVVSIGTYFLDRYELQELSLLRNQLLIDNLLITEIVKYSPQARGLITPGGTLILVPRMDRYDDVYTLIKKMLSTSTFRVLAEEQDFVQSFDYINAQFGNKIFSCLRGEACEGNY